MTFKTLPFQVNKKIVELSLKQDEMNKRQDEERQIAHADLWATIHTEYPELDEDASYSLKCEFAEQGIVMLDFTKKKSKTSIDGFIEHLMKGLT